MLDSFDRVMQAGKVAMPENTRQSYIAHVAMLNQTVTLAVWRSHLATTTSWTLLKYKVMQSCFIQSHWPHAYNTIIQVGSAGSTATPEPYRISVMTASQQCIDCFDDHKNNWKIKNFQFYCRDSWCGSIPSRKFDHIFL